VVDVALYLFLAALTVTGAHRASRYMNDIDRKTNLSAALLGGFFLALMTSLPELVASLTSTVRLDNPALAFGNVLGSNLFNLLILAVIDLLFVKHMLFNHAGRKHAATLVVGLYLILVVPFALAAAEIFALDAFTLSIGMRLSLLSLVIGALYLYNLLRPRAVPVRVSTTSTGLKQSVTLFSVFALLVVVASYFLAVFADRVGVMLGWEASFAGSVLLGAATSLPEFTVVWTLIRLKNYSVAVGSIMGSNLFNLFILFIIDAARVDTDLFAAFNAVGNIENILLLLILGLINSIMVVVALKRRPARRTGIYALPSVVVIMTYIVYIALSLGGLP